jgi:hypothetical protein
MSVTLSRLWGWGLLRWTLLRFQGLEQCFCALLGDLLCQLVLNSLVVTLFRKC